MAQMKAVVVDKPGDPGVMRIGSAPLSEIGDRELLVRVRAAGVNRADVLQRKGFYPPPPGASPIIGLEMAGEVKKKGPACRHFDVGDRVFAILSGGGYAQYVSVDERLAMGIPKGFEFSDAAAVGEVFLTAFQALFWVGEFRTGERVLIHAGASGVGTAAIQLVKADSGEALITAGSDRKLDACQALGADTRINYHLEEFHEKVLAATGGKGVDVIIDVVGADYFHKNIQCIAVDGRWVILALMGGKHIDNVDLSVLMRKRIKIMGSTLRSRSLDYRIALTQAFSKQCLPRFESGDLKPVIDRVVPWEQVREAHAAMEKNVNIGKIILGIS